MISTKKIASFFICYYLIIAYDLGVYTLVMGVVASSLSYTRARRNTFVEELCLCRTTFEKPSLSKSFLFHATSSEKPSLSAKNPLYRRKT